VISFWERQQWFNNIDFFIIGAGFTGLFCGLAIRKKYPDAKIVVAERHPIAHGASTKNAGFACFGSMGEILDDLLDEALESTLNRVERRFKGLQKLRAIIPDSVCDFKETGGFELFRKNEQSDFEACVARIDEINEALFPKLGFKPYHVEAEVNSFGFNGITGAIGIAREGMLHPAKAIAYLRKLCAAADIELLFGTEISEISSTTSGAAVNSNLGNFSAQKIILATNAFTSSFLGSDAVKPARGQVLITSPISGLPFRGTFHMDKGFYYFRNVGNRVLLGGARNVDFEGETTSAIALNQKIQAHLEDVLRTQILPGKNFSIENRWSGIMAFGHAGEKEPLVAEVQPNVFAAYRLGGMGVALSAQVADEVAAHV
jgi:glycine/D-amino acid oxidase-like deaminating enzyme